MGIVYFPSLSENNWITSPALIADSLFAQFFLSDYSQTQLYNGAVSSFAYIIEKNQGNMTETVSMLRSTLQTYFGRYFTDVIVDVTDETPIDDPSKGVLRIYLSFTGSDEKSYNLARLIETASGKIKEVIKLNNTGQI